MGVPMADSCVTGNHKILQSNYPSIKKIKCQKGKQESSAHFSIGLFCFIFDNELYELFVVDINPLSVASFPNIFFHSTDFLVVL